MHQRHTHPMLENRRRGQRIIRCRANLRTVCRMDRDRSLIIHHHRAQIGDAVRAVARPIQR